jgi:hypothetical protein
MQMVWWLSRAPLLLGAGFRVHIHAVFDEAAILARGALVMTSHFECTFLQAWK